MSNLLAPPKHLISPLSFLARVFSALNFVFRQMDCLDVLKQFINAIFHLILLYMINLTYIIFFHFGIFCYGYNAWKKKTNMTSHMIYVMKSNYIHCQQMFCSFHVNPYEIESVLITISTIRSNYFFDTYWTYFYDNWVTKHRKQNAVQMCMILQQKAWR